MKKLFLFLAVFVLILCSCNSKAEPAQNGPQIEEQGGFTYEKASDGTWIIADYVGAEVTHLTVPNHFNDEPISTIKREAFADCTSLVSVRVPKGITYIGSYAFYGCHNLSEIYIEDEGTEIERTAFDGCPITSAQVPSEQISILPTTQLKEIYLLSGEVKYSAFAGFYSLTTIAIAGDVTFADGALSGCGALTFKLPPEKIKTFPLKDKVFNLVIAPSLHEGSSCTISTKAFEGYSILRSITFESSDTPYSIMDRAFEECIAVSFKLDASLMSYLPKTAESLTVTSGEIKYLPTTRELDLKTLIIEEGVSEIEASAFRECPQLYSVTVLASADKIGSYTFYKCPMLEKIDIGRSIKTIGESAFASCTMLSDISFGAGVSTIEKNAFKGCTSITSLTLRENITSIGKYAFENCTSLKAVFLSKGLADFEFSAFDGCYGIESITVSDQSTVLTVENNALYSKDKTTLIKYFGADTEFTVPSTVTAILSEAFYGNKTLNKVVISSGTVEIGTSAFEECTALYEIDLSEASSLKTISQKAFYKCTSLSSLRVPCGVELIGKNAFYGCSSLATLTIEQGVKEIGDSAFYGCDLIEAVYLPSSITMVGERAFASCDALTKITVSADADIVSWHEEWADGNDASVITEEVKD